MELRGLKKLRLNNLEFDDIQDVYNLICQQKEEMVVLSLPGLEIDWFNESCRKTLALAVSCCKHLSKLDLDQNTLHYSDLETMLHDLPNLRSLNLARLINDVGFTGFTDKTCEIIARKCPRLQFLDLMFHEKLTFSGIWKILEGCPHLRVFHTSIANLRPKEVKRLLQIAPQLLCLSLEDDIKPTGNEMAEIIEGIGGRTLIQFDVHNAWDAPGLSPKSKEKYESQKNLLNEISRKKNDPAEVSNEWEDMFDSDVEAKRKARLAAELALLKEAKDLSERANKK